MQAVKSYGSRIEVLLAKELWKRGYRYRKNNKKVYGKPDFTFKKYILKSLKNSFIFKSLIALLFSKNLLLSK